MSSYEYLFKLIIIGDSSVGKSCVLIQFLEHKFKTEHDATIGVEFGAKVVNTGAHTLKLQIWDTAGQETFKSITRSYYRGSIGCVLLYDITSRESFDNVGKWIDETKTYANDKITLILVGNKSDMGARRAVTYEQGFEFAKKHKILFCEASAKTGQNIDNIFNSLAERICKRIEQKELDPSNEQIGIKIGNKAGLEQKPVAKKRCC